MENELYDLGFTGFVHITKEKRDGIVRKAWAGEYKGSFIMIIIKYIKGNYMIDDIKYDYLDDTISNLLTDKNNISDLLHFIKSKCLLLSS